MTVMQLEKYIISEIENLHLKIDSIADALSKQLQEIMDYMVLRFDRIESRLDQHETRITNIEV